MTITFTRRVAAAVLLLVFTQAHTLLAQTRLAGETLHISRATGSIKIDGELSDGRQLITQGKFSCCDGEPNCSLELMIERRRMPSVNVERKTHCSIVLWQ